MTAIHSNDTRAHPRIAARHQLASAADAVESHKEPARLQHALDRLSLHNITCPMSEGQDSILLEGLTQRRCDSVRREERHIAAPGST
jgi:hypothetical protein